MFVYTHMVALGNTHFEDGDCDFLKENHSYKVFASVKLVSNTSVFV